MNRFAIALVAIFSPKKFNSLFINNNSKTKEALVMLAEYNYYKEHAFKKWASSDFKGYHNDNVDVCVHTANWREAVAYCEKNNIEITRKRKQTKEGK